MNEIIKKYKNNGYVAIRIFSKEEYKIIEDYSLRWFYKLAGIAKKEWDLFPIEKYHHWSKKLKINHEEMAGFKFRYRKPSSEVNKLLTSNIKFGMTVLDILALGLLDLILMMASHFIKKNGVSQKTLFQFGYQL